VLDENQIVSCEIRCHWSYCVSFFHNTFLVKTPERRKNVKYEARLWWSKNQTTCIADGDAVSPKLQLVKSYDLQTVIGRTQTTTENVLN